MIAGMLTALLVAFGRRRTRRAAAKTGRSRRRAARVALAAGVVGLSAATVGLTAAVETVHPEWRDPEYGHRLARLKAARAASPGRPLVVAIGTSRTQNALCPTAMGFPDEPGAPRVFNFGQAGTCPAGYLLTLCRLLDAAIVPTAVLVEVLPGWMATDVPADDWYAGKEARFSAADVRHLAPYCRDPGGFRSRWRAARVAPWHAQRFVLTSHWLPRWVPWSARVDFQWEAVDPDGFAPYPLENPSPEVREAATIHARREYAGLTRGFRPGESSVRALRELAARCRERGIRVGFVVPPTSPGFRAWFAPSAWAAASAHLAALAAEAGGRVFPAPDETPDADFVDGHHMLRGGAERYSRWLADTHLKPWLAHVGGSE